MGEFNVNKSDGSLEQTAGMPSEYPATQVMLSDGVTSVEDALDGLTADTFGTSVDITSYTASNKYTCPSDGYIYLSTSSAGAYVTISLGGPYISAIQGGSNYNSIFVKKGLRVWTVTSNGTFGVHFYPLQ